MDGCSSEDEDSVKSLENVWYPRYLKQSHGKAPKHRC